jgi:hypothetical protein
LKGGSGYGKTAADVSLGDSAGVAGEYAPVMKQAITTSKALIAASSDRAFIGSLRLQLPLRAFTAARARAESLPGPTAAMRKHESARPFRTLRVRVFVITPRLSFPFRSIIGPAASQQARNAQDKDDLFRKG